MVPSTATDRLVSTDVKWGYWTAFCSHSEAGGAPGPRKVLLSSSSCLNTQWQGGAGPKGLKAARAAMCEGSSSCCPQENPSSSLATSPAVYKPVSIESDSLHQAGTEDTAQEQLSQKRRRQWRKLRCQAVNRAHCSTHLHLPFIYYSEWMPRKSLGLSQSRLRIAIGNNIVVFFQSVGSIHS